MEAILKDMEANAVEDPEHEVDSSEGSEVEEEVSKKKPGRIKGLVSGGGRDGVGKFGAVGDVLGGITDRLGVTNYGLAGASAKKDENEDLPAESKEVSSEDTPPSEDEEIDVEVSPSEIEDIAGVNVSQNVTNDDSSLESILRSLGLESEADMLLDNGDVNLVRRSLASYVGLEPRDTRLDRLLRLSLRLMPKGDEEDEQRYVLLSTLSQYATELSKWTRTIRSKAQRRCWKFARRFSDSRRGFDSNTWAGSSITARC